MAEKLIKSSNVHPKFSMCCLSGNIVLPPLHPISPELHHLITAQDNFGKSFCDHIHTYNNALSMTSISRKINETINNGEEAVNDGVVPYVFKLHGELSHKSGSLLPPEGQSPVYAQLYIYDPADAANFHMADAWNTQLDHHTLVTLQDILHCCHPAAQMYRQAHELTRNMPPEQQCKKSESLQVAVGSQKGWSHR
ncbi:hypothetical protein L208DRAFT_1472843 [Tricholoma matsutake]|nr:hypothetical protein L208DRAFT_1472843 [Tricholoma matsutake 945]